MTKNDFVANAKPLTVNIGGSALLAKPRQFKSEKGSVGFNVSGKVPVTLPDGSTAMLQVSGNLTVCGSGDWEQGEEKAAA
jgi:hypothetical protein